MTDAGRWKPYVQRQGELLPVCAAPRPETHSRGDLLAPQPSRSNRFAFGSGRRCSSLVAIVVLVGCATPARREPAAPALEPAIVARMAQYGPTARARLAPYFAAAGLVYPPERFVLIGFKHERELHLLAAGSGRGLTHVRSYPILGASGTLGPKLRQGDLQVPEGVYTIAYVNPNSVAHLSIALGYPNDYDRARALEDGRDMLGGDIMIHGGSMSIGCIAIGDEAAEDLFVLAVDAGWEDAVVVVSPVDFRKRALRVEHRTRPPWVEDLYLRLRAELQALPAERPGTADGAFAVHSGRRGSAPGSRE